MLLNACLGNWLIALGVHLDLGESGLLGRSLAVELLGRGLAGELLLASKLLLRDLAVELLGRRLAGELLLALEEREAALFEPDLLLGLDE